MMTFKQNAFIDSLMKELKERGVDVLKIGEVRDFLQQGTYGTTKQEASELISTLLEEKEKAPVVMTKDTDHIKKGLYKLLNGKRKNKDEIQFAIQGKLGKNINKTVAGDLTAEELLQIEDILTEGKYIK
jgi:pyruvate dehydrogenase complex dehydrogenase (E1) component